MDVFYRRGVLCLGLTICLLSGCESWSGSISLGRQNSDADAPLDEELGIKESSESTSDPSEDEINDGQGIQTTSHVSTSTAANEVALPIEGKERISLNLDVGERFPLVKGMTQTLLQSTLQGDRRSQTKLEMVLVLTVQEHPQSGAHAGQYLFDVKYHRVRYDQELLGNKMHFDSEKPGEQVPPELLGYQQLIGNGFGFWLGKDNQISELVGFDEFIKRCLTGIPESNAAQARSLLAGTTGSEGLSNFVDDTIGLLPPNAVQMGDSWSIDRHIVQPIPMKIVSRYSLTNFDQNFAEISILGSVSPSPGTSNGREGRPVEVVVDGGQLFGSCTIERRTGLPIHSQVNQEIAMRVKMANQPEFKQRKQCITTIRAFPAQKTASSESGSSHLSHSVQLEGIQQTSGGSEPSIVQQAGGLRGEQPAGSPTIQQADLVTEEPADKKPSQ